MAEVDIAVKLCKYINKHFRSQYKSNRDFALSAGIDEKTVRLIVSEKLNLTLPLAKRICESQDVKLSHVLAEIGE